MSWRPDNWEKRVEGWFKRHPEDNIERVVFEAGAAAMLEALKNSNHAFESRGAYVVALPEMRKLSKSGRGVFVFMPDDKEV